MTKAQYREASRSLRLLLKYVPRSHNNRFGRFALIQDGDGTYAVVNVPARAVLAIERRRGRTNRAMFYNTNSRYREIIYRYFKAQGFKMVGSTHLNARYNRHLLTLSRRVSTIDNSLMDNFVRREHQSDQAMNTASIAEQNREDDGEVGIQPISPEVRARMRVQEPSLWTLPNGEQVSRATARRWYAEFLRNNDGPQIRSRMRLEDLHQMCMDFTRTMAHRSAMQSPTITEAAIDHARVELGLNEWRLR